VSLTYRIVITDLAEVDLRNIADYIANELLDPSTARKMIAKIAEAVFQLEQMPIRNGLVRDERLAASGIRHILVDSYIVFYVVSEKEENVTIIRILYGKRQWRSLL
jgi:toxin ParE1/3/4